MLALDTHLLSVLRSKYIEAELPLTLATQAHATWVVPIFAIEVEAHFFKQVFILGEGQFDRNRHLVVLSAYVIA